MAVSHLDELLSQLGMRFCPQLIPNEHLKSIHLVSCGGVGLIGGRYFCNTGEQCFDVTLFQSNKGRVVVMDIIMAVTASGQRQLLVSA